MENNNVFVTNLVRQRIIQLAFNSVFRLFSLKILHQISTTLYVSLVDNHVKTAVFNVLTAIVGYVQFTRPLPLGLRL